MATTRRAKRRTTLLTSGLKDPPPNRFVPYSIEQAQEIVNLVGGSLWAPALARVVLSARAYKARYSLDEARQELREIFYSAFELQCRLYSISTAARRELRWSQQEIAALGGEVVGLMDQAQALAAPHPPKRRPSKPAKREKLAFVREIAQTYWLMTGGRVPGISKPDPDGRPPAGGVRSGPFLAFLRACISPFDDLASMKDGAVDKLFREAMADVDQRTAFGRAILRKKK